MSRIALGALVGLAAGVMLGAALSIHAATEPDEDTIAVAQEAGVDAIDLLGATNTTGLDARAYLIAVGELAGTVIPSPVAPAPSACGWPICGALGQRIFCVENIESHHGAAMWNPVGLLWPDGVVRHAHGWLGWMDPTAAAWGAAVGNRASEWAAAARMIAAGAGGAFWGVATGRC